uniref:uncharacterized protein LOC120816535 isoform X2 n=1 Tax=Gasterosteus aculeatus aculeatus TaxID=481459 RepID=UPI001A99412A|nr:uncharacterized protein LOC120816535 isoform X2 [Gasterosteus aculeatus aculeatus]
MCWRRLGFVLLACFPRLLHASRPDAGNAGVSTDSQKQQDTGGMSTTPGLNEGDIKPLYTKEAFCFLDPARLANLKPSVNYYIKEGEENSIPCIWDDVSRKVTCINGKMIYTLCCTGYDHNRGACCCVTEDDAWWDRPFSEPRGSTGKQLYPKMCDS